MTTNHLKTEVEPIQTMDSVEHSVSEELTASIIMAMIAHIPEDSHLNICRRENLKSHLILLARSVKIELESRMKNHNN
jgi:hypothetical protein